jgi:uncharacterized protein (TIGR02284 family)
MVDRDDQIDLLEKLIETCRDSQNGYRDAAEHVTDPEVRSFFNQQSLTRGEFAGTLENEVIRLGKRDPDRSGSASAALHRRWIDLKSALGGGEASILNEVERGEDIAKEQYEKALQANFAEPLGSIIRQQAQSVLEAHNRAKALRDRRRAA